MLAVGKSRGANGIAFLCALVAFILSLLCLFAGSPPGFLDQGSLLVVNISQIGETPLFTSVNTTNCKRGLVDDLKGAADDLVDTLSDAADCVVNKGKNKINELAADLAESVADALNLPDFFELHVMNFCSGYFVPVDYLEKNISNPKTNITYCSPKTTDFSFEPTKRVQNLLPEGITLEDIKWPEEIPKAEKAIKTASRATIVFYAMGIGCAGLSAIATLWVTLQVSQIAGLINLVLSPLAFLCLCVASIAGTVVGQKVANAINDKGDVIGIAATKGNTYIGMSWAAAILMFLVMMLEVAQFMARRKKQKSAPTKSEA